jgi:plasmid stabilization system protein ParE
MEYHVELSRRAESDLASIYTETNAEQSEARYRWYNGLEATVLSLVTMPYRGTRTREDRKLRQLLYGNKPHICRVIYSVNQRSRTVVILHIRHGAQQDFDPERIDA